MNLARSFSFLALLACVSCGSGQDKTTFLIYGEGAGPGSFTVSGGVTASGAYGLCKGTSATDIFGNSATSDVVITCNAADDSPRFEIDLSLPDSPLTVGTHTDLTITSTRLDEADAGALTSLPIASVTSDSATFSSVGDLGTVTGSVDAVFVVKGIATPVTLHASF